MIEAQKKMREHRMNPAHSVYQASKKKALEEIKEGKLEVPTLVIWGYNDPSTVHEAGIELFKYISSSSLNAQLLIFNNCGHFPYIEYPELFNRHIKSFCGAFASSPVE
jgi:pimeloyl-ACP methyl ester carboxylesterase